MVISVDKLLRFLFGVAIVFVPFTSLPYFQEIFREMAGEGAFYPFLLAMLLWGIFKVLNKNIIYIPKDSSFYMVVFFGIWVLVSGIFNLPEILLANTKGRTGVEKFFFQFLVFIFMTFVSVFIYNIFRREQRVLIYLRKLCLISFLIAGLYSSIEILFLLGNSWAADFLSMINSLFRESTTDSLLYFGRLRSICGEASMFGMYSSFVMPFLLSYLFTEKKKWVYVLLNIYLISMLILTMSRTAYLITCIQLIFFFIIYKKELFSRNKSLLFYFGLGFLIIMALLQNFSENILGDRNILDVFLSLINSEGSQYEMSNVARIGSQIAAINMFVENPIFGLGIGQYGFYMAEFTPGWAYASSEIQLWASSSPGTPWAPVHGLYARLLGEMGLIGLLLWLGVWALIIIKLLNLIKKQSFEKAIMLKSLLISIIGVLLSGFNGDSFRFFGYWILLGISWGLFYQQRSKY